jgi:hypothetical protein
LVLGTEWISLHARVAQTLTCYLLFSFIHTGPQLFLCFSDKYIQFGPASQDGTYSIAGSTRLRATLFCLIFLFTLVSWQRCSLVRGRCYVTSFYLLISTIEFIINGVHIFIICGLTWSLYFWTPYCAFSI